MVQDRFSRQNGEPDLHHLRRKAFSSEKIPLTGDEIAGYVQTVRGPAALRHPVRTTSP